MLNIQTIFVLSSSTAFGPEFDTLLDEAACLVCAFSLWLPLDKRATKRLKSGFDPAKTLRGVIGTAGQLPLPSRKYYNNPEFCLGPNPRFFTSPIPPSAANSD